MTRTRFENEHEYLGFEKIGNNEWSFFTVDKQTGAESRVGPIYRTKTELTGDLHRYASDYGFEA